ncbi:GNAT family N-acetyltransferase [Rhodocaloribacter sp.]
MALTRDCFGRLVASFKPSFPVAIAADFMEEGKQSVRLRELETEADMRRALTIREAVFVEEQGIPRVSDRDGRDEEALHVLVFVGETPAGTGRMTARADRVGHIARIAVLPEFRGRGLGRLIVEALERRARREGMSGVYLEAHEELTPFYQKLGYQTVPATKWVGSHRLVAMTKTFTACEERGADPT